MKGFTILELMVSIAIFGLMTSLTIAKYGTFSQEVLLTNAAYDVAITARTAQSDSLHTISANSGSDDFLGEYGLHFEKDINHMIMFVDRDGDHSYDGDASDEFVKRIFFKDNTTSTRICTNSCAGTTWIVVGGPQTGGCEEIVETPGTYFCDPTLKSVDVVYNKKDGSAIINSVLLLNGGGTNINNKDARVCITAPHGGTKAIYFNSVGYIGVIKDETCIIP